MIKALGGWVIDRLLPGKLTDFFLLLKSYFHRYFEKIRSKKQKIFEENLEIQSTEEAW